jgi:phosphoadenosine phosphosulfate reductase
VTSSIFIGLTKAIPNADHTVKDFPESSPQNFSEDRLNALNRRYGSMSPQERVRSLYTDFPHESVLFTSSFGTSAAILLHMFAEIEPDQKVHFIDTTYHFAETIDYREKLTEMLGLKVIDVLPAAWKNTFTKEDQTWTKDPDLCCSINKVEPLDALKPGFQVWVSGLMGFQNTQRKARRVFEKSGNLLKFHPLIDMTEGEMNACFEEFGLPKHPLQRLGYESIGCAQCTFKGKGREGRWHGKSKTECGLHL